MDYELYLRIEEPSAAAAEDFLDAIRSSLGTPSAGGIRWRLRLEGEETGVALVPPDPAWWEAPDSTIQAGVDLTVPAGATRAHLDAVCDWVFAVARPGEGILVYDPQLGRAVSKGDRDAIREGATALGAYLMDTLGVASGHGSLEAPAGARRRHLLIWPALGVVVLWIVLSRIAC